MTIYKEEKNFYLHDSHSPIYGMDKSSRNKLFRRLKKSGLEDIL